MSKTNRSLRKQLKKMQRKRRRRKVAQERDKQLEEEEAKKLVDPAHQQWLQQQDKLEELQRLADERAHAEQEEQWLRRDLLLQRQFRLAQQQRAAAEAAQEVIRLDQEKNLEALEQKKRKHQEEKERQRAKAAAEFERLLAGIEKYLNSNKTTTAPAELKRFVQTRPGEKLCELYTRTNCCRYGAACIYNHRRPLLSNIILVHHFFVHPALEQKDHEEYAGADEQLESSDLDLREDYDNFFNDVVPELESFGQIRNFRATRNVQRYLRGHVFVEYIDEKSALKAFIKLQGRYYASRRLNVEFSNIMTWRGCVCGLSLTRKCPKGLNCNYLHLFRNPGNKYNASLEITKSATSRSERKTPKEAVNTTHSLSWNDMTPSRDNHTSRHWRWSESPEIETRRLQDNADQLHSDWKHSKSDVQNEHRKQIEKKYDNESVKCKRSSDTKYEEHRKKQNLRNKRRDDKEKGGESKHSNEKSLTSFKESSKGEKIYENITSTTKSNEQNTHQLRNSSTYTSERNKK